MDNGSSGRLVNHEEGKGKGKTPPPAASKEPHAAANCRMTQPRRSLRVGASGGGVGSVVGAPVGASVWVGAAVTVRELSGNRRRRRARRWRDRGLR